MGGRSTTWDNKNRTMHRHRKSASTGEKSSDSVGLHAERGGELEEDIRPETLEAVFNHAFPKPAPETNVISE